MESKSTTGLTSSTGSVENSPKPTSPFPLGLETSKSGSYLTDLSTAIAETVSGLAAQDNTGPVSVKTTTTTTTITTIKSADKSFEKDANELLKSLEDKISSLEQSGSIEQISGKSELSSSESFSQQSVKDTGVQPQLLCKEVTAIKTEIRSYSTGSEDYEFHESYSPRTDDSSGPSDHFSGAVWSYDNKQFEPDSNDDFGEISRFSKRSDLAYDDSQNDVPPQYDSEEVRSAITVRTSFVGDPMSTSFYGTLPDVQSTKSDPIPISSTQTVYTRTHEVYSSAPGSSVESDSVRSEMRKVTDHKFLDEADVDFEKALEEHRQIVGSEVMSSITSKYEFSPSRTVISKSSDGFQLEASQKTKSIEGQIEEGSSSGAWGEPTQQLDDAEIEEKLKSWGKPLGLPSPGPLPNEFDFRSRRMMNVRTKTNNEKNLRNRPGKDKKLSPVYVDLTYVPHHGNSYYSNLEFFKNVRARYYVFSGTEPSREVFNALLEAKQTWEDKELGM